MRLGSRIPLKMSYSVFGPINFTASFAPTVNYILIFIEHLPIHHSHVYELTLILPKICQVNIIIPNLQITKYSSDEDDNRFGIYFAHLTIFP